MREEGYPKLHEDMIEGGVSPLQPKKHTPPKRIYTIYTNTKPPKPNLLEKQMGHNPPYIKGLYQQRKLVIKPNASLIGPKQTPMTLDLKCPHIPT
jgi:hypothetical protein